MYKSKRVTVCLPCRNEANHLSEVIAGIPSFVDEIIVISNKSSDNTVEVAKKLGVKALEDNRVVGGIGYGFAHMSGIQAATGDIVVGIDGDGTYPIEDLAKVIDYMEADGLDFVTCNRYPLQDGTKIPFKLQLGVTMLNLEVRALYGLKIQDILSGMWAFRADVRDQLELTMGDWNLSPQIKLNAASNPRIAYGEFSIKQHQRMGDTKQHYLKTGLSHMFWILKNRFSVQDQRVSTSAESAKTD